MTGYREGLPVRPPHIANLKLDERGYPIPYFVAYEKRCSKCKQPWNPVQFTRQCDCGAPIEHYPEFRIVDPMKRLTCATMGFCWICGVPLGRYKAFNVGPMSAINRLSAEPPSHVDCAVYAALACPFLVMPKAQRREARMPESEQIKGMTDHNPGVAIVWVTVAYRNQMQGGQMYFRFDGDPARVEFYTQGRAATRAEVLEAFDKGLPLLREAAEKVSQRAVADLEEAHRDALRFVPA